MASDSESGNFFFTRPPSIWPPCESTPNTIYWPLGSGVLFEPPCINNMYITYKASGQ